MCPSPLSARGGVNSPIGGNFLQRMQAAVKARGMHNITLASTPALESYPALAMLLLGTHISRGLSNIGADAALTTHEDFAAGMEYFFCKVH